VNEVVRNVKHLTRARREEIFDLPPEKLVVENGVVDLLTGEFVHWTEFDTRGAQTWVDVTHDPDAIPDRFNDFLFEVLHPEDVSVMWELIGYCLYRGYPFQKAALLLGEGANGKSTLLNALVDFLGEDNISTVELQEFAYDRFATADLEGKLANVAADLSSDELERTGTFKELTGGDRIRAQRKYEPAFEFENQATLLFSANNPPSADDETYAYERRWLYFEFPHTFGDEGDKEGVSQRELFEQFREEHAGILNVAIDAFGRLWERGGFEDTVWMRETDDAHERAINPTVQFVQDELIREDDTHVRIKDAYEAFVAWCDEHGEQQQGRNHFEQTVTKEFAPPTGKDPSNRTYKVWIDLRLSDEWQKTETGGTGDERLDKY